ncbi:Eukaryotic exosome, 3'-5' exoribonuclease subunit MTR3 [Giardia duodenalis]|uniref:Eukaryotic exosome, 3'-5' exoribonuclease subunit MTR3 n=1 Tax=Giardia intestinalis TaxID=5741 RepID=V6TCI8_GIAIN|nr:Eukaryotic exosome, 3'-5' exoribonuclease subunit MTR3 [Giardia intestinalis]
MGWMGSLGMLTPRLPRISKSVIFLSSFADHFCMTGGTDLPRRDWRESEDEVRLPSLSFHVSDEYLGSASVQASEISIIALVSKPLINTFLEDGRKGQLVVIIPSQYTSATSFLSLLQRMLESMVLLEALTATRVILRILPLSLNGSELSWLHLAGMLALVDSGIPLRYLSTMVGVGLSYNKHDASQKIVLDPYSGEADATLYVEAAIDSIDVECKEAPATSVIANHTRSTAPKNIIRTVVNGPLLVSHLDLCICKAMSALEPLNRCILQAIA